MKKINNLNVIFHKYKNNLKKKLKIISQKKLFYIKRNNHEIALGYDLKVKYKNNILNRYLIIKGKAVQVILVIYCRDKKKFYTIMVEQLRIGSEKKVLEFPSGSVQNSNSYKKAAIREVFEETGLKIQNYKFKKLFKPIIIQPVNVYLRCQFFCVRLSIDYKNLIKLNNNQTGVKKDKEFCKIKVIELKKLKNFNNDSTIVGLSLLQKEKKLKNIFK